MSENMLIFVAGVITGLAISLIVELVRHLLALRRDKIIWEREQRQRHHFQIQLTTFLRQDECIQSNEPRNCNPQYMLLRFMIDNVGDSPIFLTQLRINVELRPASDLVFLWTRIAESLSGNHEPDDITGAFPYIYPSGFAGKILVRVFEATSHLPVDLTTPVRIDSRDKLWLSVAMKATDDWLQALQGSNRLIRCLTFRFVVDDQRFEELGVDVHNTWGELSRWDARIDEEVDRMIDLPNLKPIVEEVNDQ